MPHDRNHGLWDLFHDPAVSLDEFDAARRSWAATTEDAAAQLCSQRSGQSV